MTEDPEGAFDITENKLLGGRLTLRQPARGYRIAIDPVLLAAAVPARPGERVLDVGAGVGAVALCLAARVEGCRVTGIEQDERLVELAADNARRNGLAEVGFVCGNIGKDAPVPANTFDYVVANPPYLEMGKVNLSPVAEKRASAVEEMDLAAWINFCFSRLKPKGLLTLIHRADRIDAVISEIRNKGGETVIFPLWPRQGVAARRVILRCRKGAKSPAKLLPGLVLHGATEDFTPEADAVLRKGAALDLGD